MFIDKKKKRALSVGSEMSIATRTVLAEGITIKDGNLYGLSSITISGVFFGDIDIEGALIITESGNLKGEAKADEAHIYGTLEGSITTRGNVHIYSGSRVISDISSLSLIIEEDAVFKGQCNTGTMQSSNILSIAPATILSQQEAADNELAMGSQPQKDT